MGTKRTVGINLTCQTFDKFVEGAEFAVVDFSAEWCSPCKALEEALRELAPQYGNKIAFGKIDIEAEENLADRFMVESVPHLILFKRGRIVQVRQGFLGIKKLQNDLERFIGGIPKDLTSHFADGDLWELDDENLKDIFYDVDCIVLLFTGKSPKKTAVKRMMARFAKDYRKAVFFAMLDSRRCPEACCFFNVTQEIVTAIFIRKQKVVSMIVGESVEWDYRAHIEKLLGVPR